MTSCNPPKVLNLEEDNTSTCSDPHTCQLPCCLTESEYEPDEEPKSEDEPDEPKKDETDESEGHVRLGEKFDFDGYFPDDEFRFRSKNGILTVYWDCLDECKYLPFTSRVSSDYTCYPPQPCGDHHQLLVEWDEGKTIVVLTYVPPSLLEDWVEPCQTPKRKRVPSVPPAPKKKPKEVEYAQAIQSLADTPSVENFEKVQGLRLRMNAAPEPATAAPALPNIDPDIGAKAARGLQRAGVTVKLLEGSNVIPTKTLDGKKVWGAFDEVIGRWFLLRYLDPDGEFCNAVRGDCHALVKHLRTIGVEASQQRLKKGIQGYLNYMTSMDWTLETMDIHDYLRLRFMHQTVDWLLNDEDMDVKKELFKKSHELFQACHRELKDLHDDPDGEDEY